MAREDRFQDRQTNKKIVESLSRELSFEISESPYSLEEIIEAVEQEFPGYKFNRTEARYMSCEMAIFEPESY